MLKSTFETHLPFITKIINLYFENGCFPDKLKLAEVSPIFKKNDDLSKENYRPVSILSHVSMVFESVNWYMQIDTFMRDYWQVLEKLIAPSIAWNMEKYIVQRRSCFYGSFKGLWHIEPLFLRIFQRPLTHWAAIFKDLSKAFDTLNHNLLIAKLDAYGFERDSLSFIKHYLNDRQPWLCVNNNFSTWEK